MTEIDFMSELHKKTERDYLARVNDKEYPKAKAAVLAKSMIMNIGMGIDVSATVDINICWDDGRKWQKS